MKTIRATCNLVILLFIFICFTLILTPNKGFSFPVTGVLGQSLAKIENDQHNVKTVVLRYTETLDLSGESEGGVYLELFNDGYISVYYPIYMRQSGNYGLYLDPVDLDRLWTMIVSKFILEFDEEAVRKQLDIQDQAQDNTLLTLSRVADAATTHIEIHPNNYRIANFLNETKRISWYGLKWDARKYPESKEIQALALIQKELQTILERTDFIKANE